MRKARKALSEIRPYKVSEFSRKDKVRLDLNESTIGCSPKVMETIKRLTPQDISSYPEQAVLKGCIARYVGLLPENIALTNGADEGIRSIMDAYLEKGDEVVEPTPTFTVFELFAKVHEARIVQVAYNEDLSFPLEGLLSAISTNTKLVVIVNPNSPTGNSIGREDIVKVLDKAKDAMVILDETYHNFAKRTYASLVKEHDNLMVLQTFSKAFGLAGLRTGYVISAKQNIEDLLKVLPPFPVNSIAIQACVAALEDLAFVDKVVEDIDREKRFMVDSYRALGLEAPMTDTNFLLVRFGGDAEMAQRSLLGRGILVKNIGDPPHVKGCLRIAIGRHEENIALVEALKEILPPEAIIFDMDGVLVDVSPSYRMTMKLAAEHFIGKEVTMEEIEGYKLKGGYNNDWDLTEAMVLARGKKVPKAEIIRKFQEIYVGKGYDGLISKERLIVNPDVLERLRDRFKLAIVTGRPRDEAEHTLRKFKIRDMFGSVVALEDVKGRDKPDPLGIQMTMKALGVKRAVYLGDNVDDMKAAKAADIVPIGVIFGKDAEGIKRMLAAQGAKEIIMSVNDVVEVLR